MADIPRDMESRDGSAETGGYQQELKRTLGSFQMFAISFAFISVAVGIFGTYDIVLQRGGPVGIWLWVLVAVGQLLVALVYAQFGPHPAQRLVLPMGLAAGQPEDRFRVRLADYLLSGDRRRGGRQCACGDGIHAALRHPAG